MGSYRLRFHTKKPEATPALKRAHPSTIRLIASCVPFLLGLIGYWLYYKNLVQGTDPSSWNPVVYFLNAMYSAIRLYVLGFDAVNSTYRSGAVYYLLEIARWTALAATTTVFVTLFRSVTVRLHNYMKAFRSKTVALHGDASLVSTLKREFGPSAIVGDTPEIYRAPTHIIAFEKEESLFRYLNDHLRDIPLRSEPNAPVENAPASCRRIYLCTQSAKRATWMNGRVTISNVSENCARLYWKRFWLHREERLVVLIGTGSYCRSLLQQALLVNVFSDHEPLEYHVFTDSDEFLRLHPGIEHFASIDHKEEGRDALFFHREPFEQSLPLLSSADRVILCHAADELNYRALDILQAYQLVRRVDIRSRDKDVISILWPAGADGNLQINPFGSDAEIYSRQVICEEQLLRNAKQIHARYLYLQRTGEGECGKCSEEPNRCPTCAHFDPLWNALSHFFQDSNIAQADHLENKVRAVLGEESDVTPDMVKRYARRYEQLTQSEKIRLWKMEHNRWCRFLYFHGWEYAPVRNNLAKKHPLLKPFEELDECEWNKDAGAYMDIPNLLKP